MYTLLIATCLKYTSFQSILDAMQTRRKYNIQLAVRKYHVITEKPKYTRK